MPNIDPAFSVLSISPDTVMKPIYNDEITITYEITGQGIKQAVNTFTIDDNYSFTEVKKPVETLVIESNTEASRIDTLNFDFNVTDPNFVLKSVKFKFGAYTSSTTMQFTIDNVQYLNGTFSFPGWIEYVSPTGIQLPTGSRRIQVYCPPSYFIPYSAANKPTVPGMTITSAAVYAMEMVYTISSSGLEGEKTVTFMLDNDDIDAGAYPISYASEMILEDDTLYEISGVTDDMLTVSELDWEMPEINITGLVPNIIAKPIIPGNNTVAINYEIVNPDELEIREMTNTFTIDQYSITENKKPCELMAIESTTRTSTIYDISFIFNVTDADFKLISFRFYFDTYSSNTQVDYRIDGTSVQINNFPSGMPAGWVEYIAPAPVALGVGSHTIRVYNSPSYFYMYSTANKPAAPGLTITSATVYKMEMVYTISSSLTGNEHTVVLTIDDNNIAMGDYPVAFESAMSLPKGIVHETDGITGNLLRVAKPFPTRDPVAHVTSTLGTAGNLQPLTVTFTNVQLIADYDELVIQITDESGNEVYEDGFALIQSSYPSISITVNTSTLSSFATGAYNAKAFILREGYQFCTHEFVYLLEDISQNIIISSITPPVIQKSIIGKNNKVTINYEVVGNTLFATNKFQIENYSFTESNLDFRPNERFLLPNVAIGGSNTSITFNFNVTDPAFKLISFKFLLSAWSTQNGVLEYRVNGQTVKSDIELPIGTSELWVEYVAPTPLPLNVGSNSITVPSTGISYLRPHNTVAAVDRPPTPGMSITSTTVYAMEMVYSLSSSNAEKVRTVQVVLDDDIQDGQYPIELESTVTLGGSGNTHTLTREIGTLEILERDNFDIGTVTLSHSGRYIGAETDITANVTGLEHIQPGDIINVILRNNEDVFFQHSGILAENQDTYSYVINASHFVGLAVGEYRVEVEVVRGLGIVEAIAPYHAVAVPTISLTSVNPDYILLPFTNPVTVQTVWAMTMAGENNIEGTIRIMGTMFSNTVSMTENNSASVNLNMHGVTGLAANVYALQYSLAVTHDIYGTIILSGAMPGSITVLGTHLSAERKNFDVTFNDVDDLAEGVYSLKVNNLKVVSSLYGTVPLNIIYDDVLSAADIPLVGAKFDDMAASVQGRYVDNEVDNTITVKITDLENVEENDKIRISFYKDTSVYYASEIGINEYISTYTAVITASVFVGLDIDEYYIKADILRGVKVLDTMEISYKVAPTPVVEFVDVSQDYINLPIFMPINIIANFTVQGEGVSAIKGELEFCNQTFSNSVNTELGLQSSAKALRSFRAFSAPVTDISIAIRNIYDIPSGIYPIDTKFSIESSMYGKANVTAYLDNVITVPNIVTHGVDTKYTYDLILCKSNRQQIAFIECFDVVYNPMFLEYNKLSFSIYREIVTEDGVKVVNPIWGKVLSDYQVLFNIKINDSVVYTEYFAVENPSIAYDGLDQLTFQAYSYEKVFLSNGNLSGFKDSVKRLYDVTNSIGPDKLPHGFLNYILKMKWYNCWTLRHVDGSVLERERVLSFTGNNMKYVIDTLEESFNCVFVFDNVNMILDIYERSIGMLGNNRGLVIADDNYMTSINYQEDTAGIRTRITVFGKNGGVISRYNPTGQLYVDDFSYYTNLQYMSQGLIDALNAYNAFVASKDGVWTSYVNRLDNNDTTVQPLIDALRFELAWENHFTDAQIKELTPFIKEDTVTINTISDGKELYRYALRHIKTTAFVPIQISVDIPDVFILEEHQKEWLKFRIGDFANIYRKEYGLEYKEMRLISYEHNPIKNTLRLEFSNKDELITMQWLNNMFFYQLENMQTQYENERDWYIEMPEFNIDDPNLIDIIQNIVDKSVTEITNSILDEVDNRVFNSITEVFETKVLSAETAHILNAWIRYLCVDMLETNFDALDLRSPAPPNNMRYYIRIQGIKMEHIEAQLSPFEIEDYKTPFGDQIYWTSINDHPQAYKYFTITDPMSVHPGTVLLNPLPPGTTEKPPGYKPEYRPMTPVEIEALREMFRVKVRKTVSSYVKKSDAFEPVTIGGHTTMIPKVIWGAGDPAGNGKGFQYKDQNSFNFTYTTQTGAGTTPVGTEIGISIRDDGCWYFDVEENEWKLIGSGGLDDETLRGIIEEIARTEINISGSHVIIDHLPTQTEINTYPLNSVVLIYNPNNPYIPAS